MNPFREHSKAFWTPARKESLYFGIFLLVMAIVIQISVGHYVAEWSARASYAHDIFLDNLPIVDLDPLIVAGEILVWVVAWWLFTTRTRYLLFAIKAVAMFIVGRAFFLALTHIGPYPGSYSPGPENLGWGFYSLFTFQGNFFFSGHTGFPFLVALIFWDNIAVRRTFLALTVLFGAVVLLAHVHYSIDVFAAPFIVYGLYRITEILFPRDRALIEQKNLK